ncbi:MAG: hypothetical protein IKV59_07550 [Lachnospiraceae bacterium]|nr:hypothetical protein [Lachnospiraceae bacterium]
MTSTEKQNLKAMITDFTEELTDVKNLLKLIHIGMLHTDCSDKDMEDSALNIAENYLESVCEKHIRHIFESLERLS